MAKKISEPQTKILRVYLGELEYEKIVAAARQSTCRSLSEYGRKILQSRPVTMTYRNRSADEAVEANIELIGAIKKLLLHPSFTETEKAWLQKEIATIETSTLKLFDLCLPK